jgi:vancomycin resistance protein VanJ
MKPPTQDTSQKITSTQSVHHSFALRLCLALIDWYGALVILYFLIRAIDGSRLFVMALSSHFLHFTLLPAFLFLAIVLYLRRWHSILSMGVAVLGFAWLFGPRFLPKPPPENSSESFTVMTYNVQNANVSPEELVSTLSTSGADIIALQELTDEQIISIEDRLSTLYPHQLLQGDGIPGIGLLSKYPCKDTELYYLYARAMPYLEATIEIDGKELRLLNAHPPPLAGIHSYRSSTHVAAEYKQLLARVRPENPFLLVGDFNTTDQSDNYALFHAAGLNDAYRAAGWGLGLTWPAGPYADTLPAWIPMTNRIDYIWYSDDFIALDAWTGAQTNSDHLPVLAELGWKP